MTKIIMVLTIATLSIMVLSIRTLSITITINVIPSMMTHNFGCHLYEVLLVLIVIYAE